MHKYDVARTALFNPQPDEGSKALQSLQEQRARLAPKFEEVKQASQTTREQVKTGFEAALSEVQKACSDLKNKLGA